MSTASNSKTSSKPDGITQAVQQEAKRKRKMISESWWPRGWLACLIMYQHVDRERTFGEAAALTYKTLFSLIPIFVLALLVLSAISSQSNLDATVQKMLFEQLQLDKMPMLDASGNPATNDEGEPLMLSDSIKPLIQKAKTSVTAKTTVAGLIAFAILAYGALSMLLVIESTFNKLYGGVKGKSWSKRIMLYWCLLTLGPVAVAASLVMGGLATATAQSVGHLGGLISIANLVSGFFISWGLVLFMYKIIPETHVKWKSAALGSFLGAAALEIGKYAFGFYVRHAIGNNFYGSLVLLPLFMLWIYLTWTFVLLGLQISYVHQYWPMLRRRFFFIRHHPVPITDLRWSLSLGILLYQRFKEGRTLAAYEAAEAMIIPNDIAEQLLIGLEEAGLVHRVSSKGYALAKPPENITAHDLLSASRALCQVPPELAKELDVDLIQVNIVSAFHHHHG